MEFVKNNHELLSAVKEAVENHFESKVTDVKFLGGGSFGMVFKVALRASPGIVALKVYKVDGLNRREGFELRLLKASCPIKIPEVYFVKDKGDSFPIDCLCMEYVEGKNLLFSLSYLFKSKRAKLRFADELTSAMHEIHSCHADKFGDVENPTFHTWQECYRPFADLIYLQAKKAHAQGKFNKSVFKAMDKAYNLYDQIFVDEVTTPSLIHGDLNIMNVMVKKPFEITAIIDPLNAKFADFEYDLFQLNNMTGPCYHLYETYKAKYPTSPNCDLKCAFYALWNEVYCYQKTNHFEPIIMMPIVRRMNKMLKSISK